MIGKMYRPLKVLSIPDRRGYSILNKYKSNFGGVEKFNQEIYLNYDYENKTEYIIIDFKDLKIPVALYSDISTQLPEGRVITNTEKPRIENLRRLLRPDHVSSKDDLQFAMLIENTKKQEEINDILKVRMIPIVYEGKEFMLLEVNSTTPVIATASNSVTVIKR